MSQDLEDQIGSSRQNGHVKFDDEGNNVSGTKGDGKPSASKINQNDAFDDSSSDDEAPEEEGMAASETAAKTREELRQKSLEKEQEELKQRRRQQSQKFAEQQEQKRQREHQELAEVGKPTTEQEFQLDLPDELPDQFFENLEQEQMTTVTQLPKHINFNDVDENLTQELKQELKIQKRKTLQRLRKQSLKRGPVIVNLLNSNTERKTMAPKKAVQITQTKDKWLRRKALKRTW
ncbi:LAMI_0C03202g1_1 [Lachancea mirantina]|uniref:LAMI_0C03202g1_1 n=1 Tax=Lachancea mirantina TaxID=1230905 RepID=A0A1G4J1Z6_9SACH|nr:LAMI_0C03202g1_1 [Lachancea mirantina]